MTDKTPEEIVRDLRDPKCGTPDSNGEYECNKVMSAAADLIESLQAQLANEPLTLEQLREMDFRSYPIWDDCLNTWCVVRTGLSADGKAIHYFGGGNRPLEANRFYRRPPERSPDAQT